MSAVYPWLFWMLTVVSIVVAMSMYDRLVRWLYANKNEEWIAIGMPTGYLFKPEGATFWRSNIKKTDLAQRWFFYAPEWMSTREDLRRALLIYRLAGICAVGGMIGFGLSLR